VCTQPPHLQIALHEPRLRLGYRRAGLSGTNGATELAPGRGSPYIEWWEGTILLLLLLACAHDITERECTNICLDHLDAECPNYEGVEDPDLETVEDWCTNNTYVLFNYEDIATTPVCPDDDCSVNADLCAEQATNDVPVLVALGYCDG